MRLPLHQELSIIAGKGKIDEQKIWDGIELMHYELEHEIFYVVPGYALRSILSSSNISEDSIPE